MVGERREGRRERKGVVSRAKRKRKEYVRERKEQNGVQKSKVK